MSTNTYTNQENPLLAAALAYGGKKGLPIFPCRPGGKEPLTSHGLKDATTDRGIITGWWRRWPAANIAIVTGAPSGLVAIDIDKKPDRGIDGEETLRALEVRHGPLPETGEQITGGGGSQRFFRHPGGTIPNSTAKLGPGVDVRGDGGYVIVPPSVHPNGKRYEWEVLHHPDDIPLADLPPAWVALLRSQSSNGTQPHLMESEPIHEGQRNATLASLAGSMRRRGMSESAIAAALLAENQTRCSPPLAEEEVKKIAHSIGCYPAGPGLNGSGDREAQAATDNQTDPLSYLAELNDDLSPTEQLDHYQALRPALLRVQSEDLAAFDLALKEVSKKLGIKTKTVKEDLAALTTPPFSKGATELLGQMGQTRQLRLAQDFVENKLWFGVIAGEDKLLLNSDRELLTLDKVPEGLAVKDSGFDLCRLSKEAIVHYLSGGTAAGAELLADLRNFFTRFAVFKDKRIPLLLATWTLGTYVYRVFRVFPYLALRSPDKRCGKSRVLDLLSLVAFNATPRLVHLSESIVFRSPSRNGGTMLLDEVEALKNADKDNFTGLFSTLNSGFEQGGSVPRHVKDAAGTFMEVSFETYCPRALAGINKLRDTLEDRSILIVMQRKLKSEKTVRFSPASAKLQAEAQALRDRCYMWALARTTDLAATYDHADTTFSTLSPLDDRARDLWEPLVSITAIADAERGDGQRTLTQELTALALDLCQVRDGAAEDSTMVQVIKALQEIVSQQRKEGLFQGEAEVTLTPTALADLLRKQLGWEKLSTKWLAAKLNPLGLFSKNSRFKDKDEGKDKVALAYQLGEQEMNDLSERYAKTTAEEDEKK